MSTSTGRAPAAGVADGLVALFEDAVRVGEGILDALRSRGATEFVSALQGAATRFPRTSSGCRCEVPAPCWMPRDLGEVTSHVCAGGRATLSLRVTNCGPSASKVAVEARQGGVGVSLEPDNLALGPQERGLVTASLALPADARAGEERDVLLWVRGSRDHFVRWTVKVAARASRCCHEVDVQDCRDDVHHWYHHFYCDGPRELRRP